MKKIDGIWFPDIDVSNKVQVEKSKRVASEGFQLDNLREALKFVTNRSVAIDGGANIGTWTNELSNHFEMVYSFELVPETFNCLKQNIRHWGIENDVIVQNRAISNVNSYVGFAEGTVIKSRSGGRHIKGKGKIPTIILDDLDLDNLGFLKLDLEGHEAQAIEGAQGLLTKFKPVVLIEHKPQLAKRYGKKTNAVSILENLGARVVHKAGKNKIDWIFTWS